MKVAIHVFKMIILIKGEENAGLVAGMRCRRRSSLLQVADKEIKESCRRRWERRTERSRRRTGCLDRMARNHGSAPTPWLTERHGYQSLLFSSIPNSTSKAFALTARSTPSLPSAQLSESDFDCSSSFQLSIGGFGSSRFG